MLIFEYKYSISEKVPYNRNYKLQSNFRKTNCKLDNFKKYISSCFENLKSSLRQRMVLLNETQFDTEKRKPLNYLIGSITLKRFITETYFIS